MPEFPTGKNPILPELPTGTLPGDEVIQTVPITPQVVLSPTLRSIADFFGVKDNLLGILTNFQGRSKFSDLFGSIGKSRLDGQRLSLGVPALQSFLDSGLIKNQNTVDLFNQLIAGIPQDDGFPEVPLGEGGGGGAGELVFPTEGPEPIDPRLLEGLTNQILQLLSDPGFDPELLQASRNNIRGDSKIAERDALFRRADDFSARGLFGSGLQTRDLERVEDTFERGRKDALLELDFANQQQITASIQQAMQGIGLLHSMGISDFNSTLEAMSLALSQLLGTRGLDLQELELLSSNIMDEFLRNLLLAQQAGNPTGDPTGVPTGVPFPGGFNFDRFNIPAF